MFCYSHPLTNFCTGAAGGAGRKAKGPDCSRPFDVCTRLPRLSGSGEEALLTSCKEFDRSTRIADVRLHRQHGPAANDTLIALRFIEVNEW
jgi:hypothetical protein